MTTSLVIFDCDGVLVDSELLASQVLAAFLSELGRPTTPEECRAHFTGMSLASVREHVEQQWSLSLPDNFVAELRARDRAIFAQELKALPGVLAVTQALRAQNVAFCVASSGAPEKIENSLTITGMFEAFSPHLFSAAHVAHGKPAPDLFLHAAKAMNAHPKECLVIEDSVAGLKAAQNAGMRALGFVGASHMAIEDAPRLKDAGAAHVISDLSALLNYL